MAGNNVKISVSVDNDNAVKGLGEVGKSLDDAEKSAKSFFANGSVWANSFSTAIGSMAANLVRNALSALKNFGAEMLRDADHCRKLSEALGMSAQDVAGFERAVQIAGGSAEGFGTAMRGLAKALDPAEVTENRKALEQLGISVKNSNGGFVSQKELLLRVADAYNAETDATKKARIGMEAFGRSAGEMTVFLNQGRQAIEEQVSMYGKASGYTEDYARTIEKLNDAMAEAKFAAMAFATAITDNFIFDAAITGLKDLTTSFLKWRAASEDNKKTEHIEKLTQATADYYKLVAKEGIAAEGTSKSFSKQIEADFEATRAGVSKAQKLTAELKALKKAYNELLAEGNESAAQSLNMDIKNKREEIELFNDEIKAKKAAKDKADADDAAKKVKEAAAEKYKSETAQLMSWLEKFKESKKTEIELAEAAYKKEIASLEELNKRKKISIDELAAYSKQAKIDLDTKLEELEKKRLEKEQKETDAFFAEIEKREREHKYQSLRLKEALAKTSEERRGVELEHLKNKYAEEERLAKETGVAIVDINKAYKSELADIEKKYAQEAADAEKAAIEASLALRETAAATEEERLNVQLERINMRYDAEVQKALETNANMMEIERARVAEIEAIEKRIQIARAETANQYANAAVQIAKSMGTLGKASGEKMKAIAIAEAIINSSLAFTKALASAPPPFNGLLASAALASGMAQVANIKAQKFAKGGVVEGNSYYGDKVPVKANSGEMILNKEQQQNLLNIANGKERSAEKPVVINFSPQIAQGMDSLQIRKMLKENQNVFEKFFAGLSVSKPSGIGVFA